MNKRSIREGGQALLLVLLAMAAVMTVVLSVASRSVTDLSISTSEEDALRAFSAAEAGIEKSLLTGAGSSGNPDSTDNSVRYESEVLQEATSSEFKYPGVLKAGEAATFWLVERTQTGGFSCAGGTCFRGNRLNDLCWGSYSDSSYAAGDKPAILLSIYYDWNGSDVGSLISSGGTDFTSIRADRRGYDPNNTRNNTNHFLDTQPGTCTVGGTTFAYHTGNILFPSFTSPLSNNRCWNTPGCLVMVKARIFYSNSARPEQVGLKVAGGPAGLPAQGNRIESTGTAGESTRKVNVFQSFAEPPSIFDSAVFSLGNFSKN